MCAAGSAGCWGARRAPRCLCVPGRGGGARLSARRGRGGGAGGMSPAGRSRGRVGAERAGCASGVGGLERPRPARWVPEPAFPSLASVTPVPTLAPGLGVYAPASSSTPRPVPSPPPKSPPLSVSPPRAPKPGARPPPPAPAPGSAHALRPPGSQRRAGPRSPCVLRGRRRGEAASAAGEGGGGQRHRLSRGGSERRRGGRDAARTAADTASRAGKIAARAGRRAPGAERGSPWWSPAAHAQSALPHDRAAAGRRGQRPPDPAAQTQVSGQREAAGSGDGWSWTPERGLEGGDLGMWGGGGCQGEER